MDYLVAVYTADTVLFGAVVCFVSCWLCSLFVLTLFAVCFFPVRLLSRFSGLLPYILVVLVDSTQLPTRTKGKDRAKSWR
jgi:hypothetical protein